MAIEASTSHVISAPKKRALEALERRFAASKPEVYQQQDHNKKRATDVGEKEEKRRKRGETASVNTPEPESSSRKGHFTFLGHNARHGGAGISGEEAHAAYCGLSQTVHENLVKHLVQHPSSGTATVNHVIHDLLQNGDSSQKYMQGSRSMKIDNYLLLDNFVPGSSALLNARVKALQSHSKRSRKHMSMRQHRACGSFEFPKIFWKFELFKPMHEMWKEYILKLINGAGKHQLGHVLLMADLQGAILQVVECEVNTFIGMSGIMVRETAETFGIVMQNDKFRVVPKMGSVFLFQAGCWKITLFGDKLSLRRPWFSSSGGST